MADQFRDILNQLKDHEQSPPEFLYERIYEASKDELGKEDVLDFQLKELGEYEIAPQEGHYAAISNSVKGNPNKVRTLFYRLGTLAAISFFFMAAWAVYRVIWKAPFTGVKETAVILPSKSPSPQPGKPVVDITVNATDSNTSVVYREKRSYRLVAPSYTPMQPAKLSGSNEPMVWVENDLLYSVLNCKYSTLSPYFENKSRQLVVDVDQYSSTTVSDKMMQFMKTLYRTNKKNKPTFKAKKAKRKLEKWKKADATYFDKPGNNHNPLDIIDLTHFAAGEKEVTEQVNDNE